MCHLYVCHLLQRLTHYSLFIHWRDCAIMACCELSLGRHHSVGNILLLPSQRMLAQFLHYARRALMVDLQPLKRLQASPPYAVRNIGHQRHLQRPDALFCMTSYVRKPIRVTNATPQVHMWSCAREKPADVRPVSGKGKLNDMANALVQHSDRLRPPQYLHHFFDAPANLQGAAPPAIALKQQFVVDLSDESGGW